MSSILWFSCGTAAELIKLFPVLDRAERSARPWFLLFTGQSPKSCRLQWDDFGFDAKKWVPVVERTHDLDNARDAAVWFSTALTRGLFRLNKRVEDVQQAPISRGQTWVVHGDTLSTLLGAMYGARLGFRVAHIEAGLRSRRLREPFPEELLRTLVGQIATLHFPPEPSGKAHLEREHARGTIVVTAGNTQLDAIEAALARPAPADLPSGAYGLVNIHRFETLISPERKRKVKATLVKASKRHRLVVVAHETTNAWIRGEPDFLRTLENNGAVWLPRQPFTKFAHWLGRAEFVIADSGGNQQECTHLGTPCLLLRDVTEVRIPPERTNVVLSRFDDALVDDFLRDPAKKRLPHLPLLEPPSDTIWAALQD